jgi:Fur family ferric uptake transcriptional regulator
MQISVKSSGKFAAVLRAAGFRATYGRVALLDVLAAAKKPVSAEKAAKAVAGKLDLTNTYRALEALASAGLVRRVDVGHQHMHYELAALVPHHHHYVCADCGAKAAHV